MSNLTIRMPEDLKRQLQEFCDQQKRPVSEVVRDSFGRHRAIERFQTLRRKTLPYAKAEGPLTDDGVLREIS